MADILRSIELNEERYLTLLEKLIGISDKVQVGCVMGAVIVRFVSSR